VCTSTSKLRFDSWARCSATFFSVENKKKIIVFKFYFLTRQSISSSLSLRPVCCISSKDNGIITKSNFPIGKKRRTKSWKGRRRRAADKRQWILDLCNRLVGCWGNDDQEEEKRKTFLLFFLRRDVCVCMRLSRMFSLYYSVASTRFVLFRPLMADAAACVCARFI
jgi:hypothetical protein